jgi:predicted transcriptional regulator
MMRNSTDLFAQPGGRAVLLSLLPKYAERIADGTKRVEFRRAWTAEPVAVLLLYATLPVSRLIGIAHVQRVVEASPTALWRFAQEYGGGVSRRELYAYMNGRKKGFALILGGVEVLNPPIDPRQITKSFAAPQSFRFLQPAEFQRWTRPQQEWRRGVLA